MTRHLVAKVLLATALAVGGACSSGDGASNEGTGGSASGGTTATGGASGGATGGAATGGQTTGGTGGIGGMPEQAGGHSGAGGAATGGHPSGGIGGSVLTGTGGGGAGGVGGATATAAPAGWAAPPRKGALGVWAARPARRRRRVGWRQLHRRRWRDGRVRSLPDERQRLQDLAIRRFDHPGRQIVGRRGLPLAALQVDRRGQTEGHVHGLADERTGGGGGATLPAHARGALWLDDHQHQLPLPAGPQLPRWTANRTSFCCTSGPMTSVPGTQRAWPRGSRRWSTKSRRTGPTPHRARADHAGAFTDNDIRDVLQRQDPGHRPVARGERPAHHRRRHEQAPDGGLSSDGVHPNDQGYAYMAGIWYAAIKDLLPR